MRNYQTMSSSANIKLFIFAAIITACVMTARAQVMGRPAKPPARVLADLKHPSAATRRDAANQLGAMRARDASRALIEALADKDAGVREAAAFALGMISARAA